MGVCTFTGIQQRDEIVFKKLRFQVHQHKFSKMAFTKISTLKSVCEKMRFRLSFSPGRNVWTVDQSGREKLFVFKPKMDTRGRGLRACLHEGWGPQVGEVTRLGWVTRPSIKSLILI